MKANPRARRLRDPPRDPVRVPVEPVRTSPPTERGPQGDAEPVRLAVIAKAHFDLSSACPAAWAQRAVSLGRSLGRRAVTIHLPAGPIAPASLPPDSDEETLTSTASTDGSPCRTDCALRSEDNQAGCDLSPPFPGRDKEKAPFQAFRGLA